MTSAVGAIRPRTDRFAGVETALAWATELPAAVLVVAEIVLLFSGVVARYAFNKPLIWSDELASILFIWLAMFGAVIALRRDEHMRLTAVVRAVPERWRPWLQAVVSLTVVIVLAWLLVPTYDYVRDQWSIITPALHVHDTYRVLSIAVGLVLMFAIAVVRLMRTATLAQIASACAVVLIVGGALWLGRPAFGAMGNYALIVFFVLLVGACIAMGTPIGFSFGIATLAYLSLATNAPLTTVVSRLDEGMSELILLSIPLFVVLGILMEIAGVARALIAFMASLLGHVRGGLSYVLIGGMFLVSGISGSKAADMAAVAPAVFPEMKRRGSEPGELVALLSATGAMSETIPPSFTLITIGSVTGVSIGALFTAGLLPGVVCTLALAFMVFLRSRRERATGKRAPLSEIARTLVIALPALALPFLIRATVIKGIATATEVSTVGVVYTVLAGLLVYRQFDLRRIYPMLISTATLSGAILFIIGMASSMAWALTQSGFSQQLVTTISRVPGGQLGFLAISIVAFAILGSVLEGIPAIVLFGPLLFPAARALGIPDVHFAIVAILAMGLGLFAPPCGVGFFAACAIGGVSPDEATGRIWPYLGVLLVATVICALLPWLSMSLIH